MIFAEFSHGEKEIQGILSDFRENLVSFPSSMLVARITKADLALTTHGNY